MANLTRRSVISAALAGVALGERASRGEDLTRQGKKLVMDTTVSGLGPQPRLLVSAKGLPALRERAKSARFSSFFADLTRRCDRVVATTIALPDRGSAWFHLYACPTHGTRLRTESPTRHVCPTGGEVFTGYPYDDCVLLPVHQAHADSVRDLGLLFLIGGDQKYAVRAKEILLAYAAKYASYSLHDTKNEPKVGGGKVGPQTLDESVWLIPIAQGADAIWETLTPSERDAIRDSLLLPAVDVIRRHKMGVHNIQCWKNAAVGLVGLLLGDFALVSEALDDPARGLQKQILDGVDPDGPWYEGAWSYHFYTMSALVPLLEAANNAGVAVYSGELGTRLRAFFAAPIELALPDGKLPAFNDSGSATARGNALYEYALARFDNPALFGRPLVGNARQSLPALVAGGPETVAASSTDATSRVLSSTGYAILRLGSGGDAGCAIVKFGPHGGGHGHPDKGNVVFFASGETLLEDPGTANYGVPIQAGWYKTTIAHNALTVDETSQVPATGSLVFHSFTGDFRAALIDSGPIYAGVTHRRAVVLVSPDTLLIVDRAVASAPRTFDLALHVSSGSAPLAPLGEPIADPAWIPPQAPGYRYLRDMKARKLPAGFAHVEFSSTRAGKTDGVQFIVNAPGESSCLYGTGVGKNSEDRVPIVVARTIGREQIVVSLITRRPEGARAPRITSVGEDKGEITVGIARVGETRRVRIGPNGVQSTIEPLSAR